MLLKRKPSDGEFLMPSDAYQGNRDIQEGWTVVCDACGLPMLEENFDLDLIHDVEEEDD